MKRLVAIVLAVVLLASGFGGFAYAKNNSNETMTGQKLVGVGGVGTLPCPDGSRLKIFTNFWFTNPDCVGEITIERMSIFKSDGTVIYEGPFLHTPYGTEVREEKTEPMKPHEIWRFELALCIPDGEGGWLTKEEAKSLPYDAYTAEVFWSGSGAGCPLIGSLGLYKWSFKKGRPPIESAWSTNMVNMKQKLK